MPYKSETVDRLYVVRWDNPDTADVAAMEREVARVAGATSQRLRGLSIVPSSTTPPDDATRSAMGKSLPHLLEHLETMHVVIEGTGFKHTILRSAMTGIILVGGKRGRVFVHSDVESAIGALATALDMSAAQLRSRLTAFGLMAAG